MSKMLVLLAVCRIPKPHLEMIYGCVSRYRVKKKIHAIVSFRQDLFTIFINQSEQNGFKGRTTSDSYYRPFIKVSFKSLSSS